MVSTCQMTTMGVWAMAVIAFFFAVGCRSHRSGAPDGDTAIPAKCRS